MTPRAFAICVGVFLVFLSLQGRDACAVSKAEIIKLAGLGIGPAEMIQVIEKDRTIFKLTINDILALKNAKVPEKVIRFMLSTPQRFGAAPPTTPPKAAPVPPKVAPVPPPSPEASAESRIFLKIGMELAEAGEHVEAIRYFVRAQQSATASEGGPDTYTARFGIAMTLMYWGVYLGAAELLAETVLQGPQKVHFQEAFEQLRVVQQKFLFSPASLEKLSGFYVGNFSQEFQDSYNYFLGTYFFGGRNYSAALKYLQVVSSQAPQRAAALYLTGHIQVANQMYKSGVWNFEKAILAQEATGSDVRVAHHAYLALARLAYMLAKYDIALAYYERIPEDSPLRQTALDESGLCIFVMGDTEASMNEIRFLRKEGTVQGYYPDLFLREAILAHNDGRAAGAGMALAQFREWVGPVRDSLARSMRAARTPAAYYESLFLAPAHSAAPALRAMLREVRRHPEIDGLHRTVKELGLELAVLRGYRDAFGPVAAELIPSLEGAQTGHINGAGIKIQYQLRRISKYLMEYQAIAAQLEQELKP